MGKPVDDYPIGELCELCWSNPQTPAEIYIAFHGTDFDGTYTLPQYAPPCHFFSYFDDPTSIFLACYPGYNRIEVLRDHEVIWYSSKANCEQLHDTEDPAVYAYWWWGVHPILKILLGQYHLLPIPGSKYEAYAYDVGDWDFRVANTNGRTNILIKFRPQFDLDN